MKKIRQQDDKRPAIAAADHLLGKILPSAFTIFRDSRFREIANFEKLDQAEHDRIFNELEIAGISSCLFCLEQRESIIQYDDFHFWEEVHKKIPIVFERNLLRYGADQENARLFKDLISVRHEEYSKLNKDNHDWMEKEIFSEDTNNARAKELMARVQAISIGTADHIRRGNLKEGDKLIRHLRDWLFPLNFEVEKFIKRL